MARTSFYPCTIPSTAASNWSYEKTKIPSGPPVILFPFTAPPMKAAATAPAPASTSVPTVRY